DLGGGSAPPGGIALQTRRPASVAGGDLRASSTSSGKTFSPTVLMQFDPRPRRRIVPSASSVASRRADFQTPWASDPPGAAVLQAQVDSKVSSSVSDDTELLFEAGFMLWAV